MKPPRLAAGQTVALVNPAGATFHSVDVDIARESLEALGLRVKLGRYLLERRGYFAGDDESRARDFNDQLADPEVKAVVALRGGFGCARILPLLDFDQIRAHPRVIVGYSDVTALLLGIYARTGLVTFHGPVGTGPWNSFTVDYFRRILFRGEAVTLANPKHVGDHLTQTADRVETLRPGRATGRLVGGNLTVLASIVGSPFLPDWEGKLLFLEDIGEQIYRVDRMLTQLKLAGILSRIGGFIFGKCTDCEPGAGYGSLTLEDVFRDHILPLDIPAWRGAMIGHIAQKFTLPIGVQAEIDARPGTIRMLEPAVV